MFFVACKQSINDVTNSLRRYPVTLACEIGLPGGSHVPAVAIYVWWLVEWRAAETTAHAVEYIGAVAVEKYLPSPLSDEVGMFACNGANVTMVLGGAALGMAVIA
jgi:hypothetical protein